MKRILILYLVSVWFCIADAEIRFNPLNVERIEGVVGVTHDELRDAISSKNPAFSNAVNETVATKADKPVNSVEDNLAAITADGNLKDSGIAKTNVATKAETDAKLAGKRDKDDLDVDEFGEHSVIAPECFPIIATGVDFSSYSIKDTPYGLTLCDAEGNERANFAREDGKFYNSEPGLDIRFGGRSPVAGSFPYLLPDTLAKVSQLSSKADRSYIETVVLPSVGDAYNLAESANQKVDSIYPVAMDASQKAYEAVELISTKADIIMISAENPTFSSAVLAVNVDFATNTTGAAYVAVTNALAGFGFDAEALAELPGGKVYGSIGALLAALAAAVAWLKKNKVQTLKLNDNSVETSADGGVAKLDDFFTESNSLLTATIAANSARLALDEDGEIIVTMNTED